MRSQTIKSYSRVCPLKQIFRPPNNMFRAFQLKLSITQTSTSSWSSTVRQKGGCLGMHRFRSKTFPRLRPNSCSMSSALTSKTYSMTWSWGASRLRLFQRKCSTKSHSSTTRDSRWLSPSGYSLFSTKQRLAWWGNKFLRPRCLEYSEASFRSELVLFFNCKFHIIY